MEAVTIKFQEDILSKIDKTIEEHNFNSRTEFIREAVRDKISELRKEDLLQEFLKFRGKSKIKTTPEDNKTTKAIVSKELMEELNKRFN